MQDGMVDQPWQLRRDGGGNDIRTEFFLARVEGRRDVVGDSHYLQRRRQARHVAQFRSFGSHGLWRVLSLVHPVDNGPDLRPEAGKGADDRSAGLPRSADHGDIDARAL